MLTFYDMGSTGAIDAGRIMTGLSLALKATALGLAVAIPTLISYNGLQRAMNVASGAGPDGGEFMTIEVPKKEPLNIVPFIDIMLVLLAMVLSISTFIAKGEIQINLPKSKTADVPKEAPEQRIVQVDAMGDFFLDSQKLSFEELAQAIANLSREQPVLLRVDKDSTFDHFIQVIDLFKANNHENFRIATEKEGR